MVLIVEEIAFLDFLKRKNVGMPLPSTLYTVTSVGSPDEDTLKSTGSWIMNEVLPEAVDVTIVLAGINNE